MIEPVYHAAASEKLLVTILRTGVGEEGAVTPDHTLLDQIVQRLNARLLNTKSILAEHIVLIRQAVRWSDKNIFVGQIR